MANRLVVFGGWLVRGDAVFEECSDGTRESYRRQVGVVQAEWAAEIRRQLTSRTTGVRSGPSCKANRGKEVHRLVATLSGAAVFRPDISHDHLEQVSRRQTAAAKRTEKMRGGAPDHLSGDGRRNFRCPPVRLDRETARLVRRMILVAAQAPDGYKGDPHTVSSMANLLLIFGAWVVFRDDVFEEVPPGCRAHYRKQAYLLREKRIGEADSTAGGSSGPPQAMDGVQSAMQVAGNVAASVPALGLVPTLPVVDAPGMKALGLWGAKLGIRIKWSSDNRVGYAEKPRVLLLPKKSSTVDQFGVILMGMAWIAPSIRALPEDMGYKAANLAGGALAVRLQISEYLATHTDDLKWGRLDDFPQLRAPVDQAVNWLWGVLNSLPPTALMDLTSIVPLTRRGGAP